MGIIYLILFSTVSYLIGSIPFGFLITKIFKNKDVREYGSKNTGATNVLRVAGKKLGLFCLFLDIVKGFIPVTLIVSFSYNLLNGNISIESYKIFLGFFAIAGHIWPVYLKFKGGKGVATAFGVLLGIEPVSVIAVFCIWIIRRFSCFCFNFAFYRSFQRSGSENYIIYFNNYFYNYF
jgi:glycerol-3-phosphate acyltransferase PlsY